MGDSQKPLRPEWMVRPIVWLLACASLASALLYPLQIATGDMWVGPIRVRFDFDLSAEDTTTQLMFDIMLVVAEEVARGMVPPPQGLTIAGERCGRVNAFYSRSKREIHICFELIDYLLQEFSKLGSVDSAKKNVLNAGVFFVLHELGHAVIHQHDIPVTGREEDAADAFAAWWVISVNKGFTLVSAYLALDSFSPLDRSRNNSDQYGYAHGLPEQRQANFLCWYAGSGGSLPIEEQLKYWLPPSRLLQCRDEYASINRTWAKLLGGSPPRR